MSTAHNPFPGLITSERLYGLLLRLYPRSHQTLWGDELREFFRDQYRESFSHTGWRGVLVTWVRAAFDTASSALLVRFGKEPGHSPRHRRPRTSRIFPTAVDHARHHLVYAVRQIWRSPGLTLSIMLTLGLGIGANATMFGVIDRLLLRAPDHVREPDDIRRILVRRFAIGATRTSPVATYPDYADFDAAESFLQTATYSYPVTRTFGRGTAAQRVRMVETTASLFTLLGVRPALGHFFTDAEDQPDMPGLAVLEYTFWRRQFGADESVIGSRVKLGDQEYTVVGVAPRGFTGAELRPVDLWTNLHSKPGGWAQTRGWHFLTPIARLRPGVESVTAEAEATLLHRQGRAESSYYDPEATILLTPLIAARGPNASDESVVARWLAGVAIIVLIIACANVANLLLARGVRRRRETAIRLALGVSRARLITQLLTESVLLALLGGVTGLLFARWGGSFVRNVLVPEVAWIGSPVSVRVLMFSVAATLLTGLLAGLVPALQSSRSDIALTMKTGEHSSKTGSKTRIALLVGQAALSAVLLIGAGLFVRSLLQVRHLDMGFDPAGVLAVSMEFEQAEVGDSSDALIAQLHTEAVARVAALPGVEHAASSLALPFWSRLGFQLEVPGVDSIPTLTAGGPYLSSVSADYVSTMGMTVIRGRDFTAADDREGADPVSLVNETMARILWPEVDPLEQCLLIGTEPRGCASVVGVLKDTRESGLDDDEISMLYFTPGRQQLVARAPRNLLIRIGGGDETHLVETVRREIHALHPAIRYVNVRPMQSLIDPNIRSWKLGATMFSVFGGLALLIAVVGLYSVLAFNVAQRTHELGIRAALGAGRSRLLQLVFRQAVVLVAVGLLMGVTASMFAVRAIEPLLFRVSPRDPVVFVVVIVTLVITGMLAALLPARRATAVDPIQTLRAE